MVASFEGTATFRARHSSRIPIQTKQCALFNAASDAKDSVRRMLESSWNTSKMGRVPVDPEAAAEEAYTAILHAAGGTKTADGDDIEETDSMTGTFFIDLLLPAYDISQVVEGVALYDEVIAVEYCIALADCFKGKTEILVRDDKIVQTVTKVQNARKEMEEGQAAVSDGDVMFGDGDDGDVVFGDGNFVDDSKDTLDDVDEGTNSDPDDDFRQKLLANWNDPDAPTEDGIDISSLKPSKSIEKLASTSTSYRLTSLFGNTKIKEGPDMAAAVIQAVRDNALAADDEDNIIILSARGKDEMVAVRGLVAKYGSQKKIIMVNCQFSPVPRELQTAETVYSVLPLAGKKTTNDDSDKDNEDPPPKIVVLRRYPKDWEIFVDVGIGYELAENVAMNLSNKRGLGMEFIARAVARHLDFVSRR
jgi:hypothetical protein